MDTRYTRLSRAPVHLCGVSRIIHTMPYRPPLVGGAMQAAGGGRLNPMLPQRLSKSFPPTLEIGFSGIQPGPIKSCSFDGEMHMRMTRRVGVRVGLERVQHHRILMVGELLFCKVARARCTESGSVCVGTERMR